MAHACCLHYRLLGKLSRRNGSQHTSRRPGVTSTQAACLMRCTLQNQKCKWMCESSSGAHGRHHPAGSHRDRHENKQLHDGFINPLRRGTVRQTLKFMLWFIVGDKNLICQGTRRRSAPNDKQQQSIFKRKSISTSTTATDIFTGNFRAPWFGGLHPFAFLKLKQELVAILEP